MDETMQILRDATLLEIMTTYPLTIRVFLNHRMRCVGCPIAPFHTVADACAEYDLDEEAFIAELLGAVIAARQVPQE